jgi:NADPH-dependent 2,4-dienoyl-CoA reductase/sulfur reductase-like enzyme
MMTNAESSPSECARELKMSLAGSYDVIVLGSGIAGLAAALTAQQNGLSDRSAAWSITISA